LGYRWVILAAGTAAQTSYAALFAGISIIAPRLRDRYDLSLTEVGIVLACVSVGSMLTLLPWGLLADRIGERLVIAFGLVVSSGAVAAAGWAGGFRSLTLLLVLSGIFGASVNAASGRAVMGWFPQAQRGTALGIRQTAIPIGSIMAALVLPRLSLEAAFVFLAAGLFVSGLAGGLLVREPPSAPALTAERIVSPLRDARMWRLASGSALLLTAQVCLVGFAVLFLHEQRKMSEAAAGLVVAVVSVIGAGLRIATGRWSDVLGARIVPLRRISLALAAAAALTAVVVSAPLAVLVPTFVAAGALAMSWNALSFTAAAEVAGQARSGAALGFQQTVLAGWGALAAPVFAATVAATSWRAGFALVAVAPIAAWRVLGRLTG
jgi:sugar phosphate permease